MPLISSRELGLQSGELELIEGQVDTKWVDKMNSIAGVKAVTYGPSEVNVLHINKAKAPFNDIRVRKAVGYAISRQQIADFQGEKIAVPLYAATLAPPAPGALTKEEAIKAGVVFENDIQKAKELLAEAGYPNGFEFEAIISEMTGYKKTMVAVQAQLKKAGFNMNLKVVDHPSFHSLIRKDASPLVDYSTWRANVDASLSCFFHSDSVVVTGKSPDVNFSHCTSADDLIEKAKFETDPQKQIALWKEAQIQILKEVNVIPLTRIKTVFAVTSYVDLGHPATWMWTNSNCQVAEKTKILAH
jgi:peptide/nickel transport system substrate-binding protein